MNHIRNAGSHKSALCSCVPNALFFLRVDDLKISQSYVK